MDGPDGLESAGDLRLDLRLALLVARGLLVRAKQRRQLCTNQVLLEQPRNGVRCPANITKSFHLGLSGRWAGLRPTFSLFRTSMFTAHRRGSRQQVILPFLHSIGIAQGHAAELAIVGIAETFGAGNKLLEGTK